MTAKTLAAPPAQRRRMMAAIGAALVGATLPATSAISKSRINAAADELARALTSLNVGSKWSIHIDHEGFILIMRRG